MRGIATKQDTQHDLIVQMGQKVDPERVERIKNMSQLREERQADLVELRTQFAELWVSGGTPSTSRPDDPPEARRPPASAAVATSSNRPAVLGPMATTWVASTAAAAYAQSRGPMA